MLFKFRLSADEPVRLAILDNNENEIKSLQLKNNNLICSFTLTPSEIKSGLYYWKIEDENEVLYVSKFYFVKAE